MNSYDFFIHKLTCFMNSYMNSGVPRFQVKAATGPWGEGVLPALCLLLHLASPACCSPASDVSPQAGRAAALCCFSTGAVGGGPGIWKSDTLGKSG